MSHPCRHVFIASNSLWQAVNVVAIYLDMDSEWWETWGCKFELGILDWIKSRPRMIRFDMKTLNNSLQAQIQALLLDQRRRIRRSRRWQQPCSFSALLASEIAWQTSKSWFADGPTPDWNDSLAVRDVSERWAFLGAAWFYDSRGHYVVWYLDINEIYEGNCLYLHRTVEAETATKKGPCFCDWDRTSFFLIGYRTI